MRRRGLDPREGYRNDYERLLKLQVFGESLDELDALIADRRTWVVARLTRADRLLYRTKLTRDQLETAAHDVALAREMFPSTPVVLTTELAVHSRIIETANEHDMERSREIAMTAAQELARYPSYPWGRFVRMQYYRTIGQSDLAAQELRVLREMGFGGRYTKAIELYRDNEIGHAIEILRNEPYMFAPVWLAFVQAEEDCEIALNTYREFISREDIFDVHRMAALEVLMLVGKDPEMILR